MADLGPNGVCESARDTHVYTLLTGESMEEGGSAEKVSSAWRILVGLEGGVGVYG